MKKLLLICFAFVLSLSIGVSQQIMQLNDLSEFSGGNGNWTIVGDVNAPLSKNNTLKTSPGSGVLVCTHEKGKYGFEYDLLSKLEHGDLDLEFDFMMSVGANSGVYLQGQYEIQLFDSWGTTKPKYSDVGGIYERWDDTKPDGMKGYQGHAPRVNAAKAPGLWQTMKISFQAPRFDNTGTKTQNAKILSIVLNGMVIHENVELSGRTRGAMGDAEVALGPLRFQGDHGSVAFRNIKVWNFNQPAATVSNLTYGVNYNAYDPMVNPMELAADKTGELKEMNLEFLKQSNPYTVKIKGTLTVPANGEYTFDQYASCSNALYIDGEEVLANAYTGITDPRSSTITLTKGDHDLLFYNAHFDPWMATALGVFVSGPGFRATPLHSASSLMGGKPTDPILVEADKNTILRSFMDYDAYGTKTRIVHNVNVGHTSGRHYSYNMDKGSIFQMWQGGFLDATPMWNSRGDGSSRPLGSKILFRDDLLFSKSSSQDWPSDTTGTSFKPLGYKVNQSMEPSFMYSINGMHVTDKVRIIDGKKLHRTLTLKDNPGMYARLAAGNQVEEIEKGLFAIDKNYYIQVESDLNVLIRKKGNLQELVAPITVEQFSYSIIY